MAEEDAERLRDAFAQLLAMGNNQAAPAEAVWAQQGAAQFPPPPPTDVRRFAPEVGPETDRTPSRNFRPDPDLDFPQAMPGLRGTLNPWLSLEPSQEQYFGGKGKVVGPGDEGYMLPKPYELPKSEKKKKSKKGKG